MLRVTCYDFSQDSTPPLLFPPFLTPPLLFPPFLWYCPVLAPNTLVLSHFSECYIGIIFSGTNFVVFFKLRFSDKRFSSWPLACHKIILPVRMLRMLRTLFCRDTSFFFHTYYHLRLRCRNSTFDSSTRRLDRDAVGTCLGASISSDHFPSFENVENFVLSWNIQNVHPFHPSIGHGSESTQLVDTLQCKCQVLCTKMIAIKM